MEKARLFALLLAITAAAPPDAGRAAAPRRTFLAVGAHAGDMEIAAGALLAKQVKAGDRAVLLHLTLGEGGNPKLSPQEYGKQKRREAEEAAKALGAEVLFGPYQDGQLPDSEASRLYVADAIRQVRPTHLLAHWKNSLHKDHEAASAVARDAVLLASLPGVRTDHPPHSGVRAVWFTENWEDKEGFQPYVFVDVTEGMKEWEDAVARYEFIRGGISRFPYLEYYKAQLRVRGAEGGLDFAECFDVQSWSKKQVYRALP